MSYSLFYLWPNYSNRDELALEFYHKAANRLAAFSLPEDVAVCLCKQGNDSLCYFFVGGNRSEQVVSPAIDSFLKQAGCPKHQELADGDYIPNLTVVTIPQNLAAARATPIACTARVNGQVREMIKLPLTLQKLIKPTKKWWQFWK